MFPEETLNAFDIPRVRAGIVPMRHMTLADVVALERLGVDVTSGCARVSQRAIIARHLATGPARFMIRFMPLETLLKAASRALEIAFMNAVPGERRPGQVSLAPEGYGWPLEAVDTLMSEYGLSFDAASRLPLARVFALFACARIRNGGRAGGPDYYARIAVKRMKKR